MTGHWISTEKLQNRANGGALGRGCANVEFHMSEDSEAPHGDLYCPLTARAEHTLLLIAEYPTMSVNTHVTGVKVSGSVQRPNDKASVNLEGSPLFFFWLGAS